MSEATEPVTITPTEYQLRLRLKRGRFLVALGDYPLGELQTRLDRCSRYMIRRLQRRYRALGVSKPTWSVDPTTAPAGMPKYAYLHFGYIDLTPYTGDPCLVILKDETHEVSFLPNRAARRALP